MHSAPRARCAPCSCSQSPVSAWSERRGSKWFKLDSERQRHEAFDSPGGPGLQEVRRGRPAKLGAPVDLPALHRLGVSGQALSAACCKKLRALVSGWPLLGRKGRGGTVKVRRLLANPCGPWLPLRLIAPGHQADAASGWRRYAALNNLLPPGGNLAPAGRRPPSGCANRA